jgi:hypothetical protein
VKGFGGAASLPAPGREVDAAGTRAGRGSHQGRYKADGNRLSLTSKAGDRERAETLTVTKLTDDELVTTDEKGQEEAPIRGQDKKRPAGEIQLPVPEG